MSNRLREIVNHLLLDFELHEVYMLADYDAYENDDEAEAHAPAFDLNNPEHREAL